MEQRQGLCKKTVTTLAYDVEDPYSVLSGGLFHGYAIIIAARLISCKYRIIHCWDVRCMSQSCHCVPARPVLSSCHDPTPVREGAHPRGVISLCPGVASTSAVFFALCMNSRVHVYSCQDLTPLSTPYHHSRMLTDSFATGLSLSLCGRWLACRSVYPRARVFLFDVENAAKTWETRDKGVELWGCFGAAGKVDWGFGELLVTSDSGSINVWRPDVEVYRRCQNQPQFAYGKWGWSGE